MPATAVIPLSKRAILHARNPLAPHVITLSFLKESVTCYLLLLLFGWIGHLGIVLHHGLELRLQIVEDPAEQLIIVLGPHNAVPALHPSQRDFVVIELCL